MGDRILFQVYSKGSTTQPKGEVSPVIYGHWAGARGSAICAALQSRMKGREGDVSYTAARLVQELIGDSEGNLGFGIWASKLLKAKDSHGDAGIVLVECNPEGLHFDCLGGYLKASADRTTVEDC